SSAVSYAGHALARKTVNERKEGDSWALTNDELREIELKARSISAYGNIQRVTASNFLVILCSIDRISDMKKISDALEIEDLNNPNILRQPMTILSIPELEKIAYMASAVDGFVRIFSRYLNTKNFSDSSPESISNIMNNLS